MEKVKIAYDRFLADERHKFVATRAAVRIALGAYAWGEISEKALRNSLERFKKIEGIDFDVEEHIRKSRDYRSGLDLRGVTPLSTSLGDGKVLLIDDEYNEKGWKHLFDAVFSEENTLYAKSTNEAKNFIDTLSDELAFVLLDLKIPEKPEGGLNFLRYIKRNHLDLPVIIFSGVDETLYTKKCFKAGAFDYFVKEIGELDRSSLDYYQKFKEMVEDALSHPEWRNIWRRIGNLPGPNEYTMGSKTYKKVISCLRKAYFFLTITEDSPYLQFILPEETEKNPTKYWGCILQCAIAIEVVIDTEIKSKKKKLQKTYPELYDFKEGPPPFGKKTDVLRQEEILTEGETSLAKKVWKERGPLAHSPVPTRNESQTINIFNTTFNFFESYFSKGNK